MKQSFLLFSLIFITLTASAQQKDSKLKETFTDLTIGFTSKQTSIAAGYLTNWTLGKKKRFYIGTGLRLNAVYSKNQLLTSAPPKLASDLAKTDTLIGSNNQFYAFNAIINVGYHISPKLDAGFNIDLIGFSFGSNKTAQFINNGNSVNTSAKPTGLNILLIGNNDRGTLNSEFYLRYKVNQKLGLKLAVQHFFTELTTATNVQSTPIQNDRFRNISNLVAVGVAYHF